MNTKLQRVHREIDKTKDKITILQGKMRELENLEIVDTVRGLNISLTDLGNLLKTKQNGGFNQ